MLFDSLACNMKSQSAKICQDILNKKELSFRGKAMQRTVFEEDHQLFREAFRKFVKQEILPHYGSWQDQGFVPRELWKKAGKQGFLCPSADEKYGGVAADFLFSVIISEELYYLAVPSVFIPLHNDICFPYINQLAGESFKDQWIPKCINGETILALAMTEPEAGSDVSTLKTKATLEGDHYRVNGSKTFISNGQTADLFIVAVKTDLDIKPAHKGISLLAIEGDRQGFKRGQNLKKIGLHAQDTSELFFEDCLVPKDNLLGEEGKGFQYLMNNLQQERLLIAISGAAAMWGCLDETIKYVKERKAFGKTIADLQTTRFELAELATKCQVTQSFVDDLIIRHAKRENIVKEVSMAKYWASDAQFEVADRCLQLFGGYGYMEEYPIARQFVDARVQRIYGGTNEIMKELIARNLFK